MTPTRKGAFHLFQLAGINVYLHWSWFVVAVYQISTRTNDYTSPIWKVFEYLALFLIVLMHEFGHSLACRQVGGKSDQIVLWPLGGVAYVNAPQRPGATLWSIVAGPLVNVILVILLWPWMRDALHLFLQGTSVPISDEHRFLCAVTLINLMLLVFNIMPVYPLDGGQILRSLLWFPLGRARSLLVATLIGFLGGIALIGFALWVQSLWFAVIAGFLLMNCWSGFQQARALRKLARLPRHADFKCPVCRTSPPIGPFWGCGKCGNAFDTFATNGVCPHCAATYETSACPDCGESSPRENWKS